MKIHIRILGLALCSLLMLFGCNQKDSHRGDKTQREATKSDLTMEYAFKRSSVISNVDYDLEFDLTKAEEFSGTSTVSFMLKAMPDFPMTLDFTGGKVSEVTINDEPLKKIDYNGFFLALPKANLKVGENKVKVTFTHGYSKTGAGLYRFEDKDKKVYTYTDFEPYDANHMFPSFDQPNLKATYKTKATVPPSWTVVSSTREDAVSDTENGNRLWSFPKSAKFSTYIYSLHAGEYKIFEDKAVTKNHTIPLRLFVRQSLAPYVKLEDWFKPTKQGFTYFEDYFGYPYPYVKYDQVIVPDFNSGAMENVAAVTFNEFYVSRGPKAKSLRRGLANVIFHEMAHMWFGNLVTMEWWNDLWLNESFATLMANKGLVEATEYKENWQVFFSRRKQGAYQADQLVTTHPIEATIPSTSAAFANFDAITYGKGASSLKQLIFYVTDAKFKTALQGYFKKYAEKNTTLADFMGSIEEASGKDMTNWTEKWLRKESLNTVAVEHKCEGGKISSFDILQTYEMPYATLRPHRVKVALFNKEGSAITKGDELAVEFSEAKTSVPGFVGKKCPDLIYPNYEDHDFVKVVLDEKSIETAKNSLSSIDDDFMRSMVWVNLWDMVRDQKLTVVEFLDLAKVHGMQEQDNTTLSYVVSKVPHSILSYFPDEGEWDTRRKKYWSTFEEVTFKKLAGSKADAEKQKIWLRNMPGLVFTPQGMDKYRALLDDKAGVLSFKLDQDRRWSVIHSIARRGMKDARKLLDAEKKRDGSARGAKQAFTGEASFPDLSVKKKFFAKIAEGPKNESLGNLRAMIWGLFPASQRSLRKEFVDEFFTSLLKLKDEDPAFLRSFTNMVPTLCTRESSEKISNFVKTNDLPEIVEKSLKNSAQEDMRCHKIREFAKKQLSKEKA